MKISLLCPLLGLALTGCGLFQVTVNGKQVGKSTDPSAASGSDAAGGEQTAAAATDTTTQAPADLPARKVELGDMVAKPIVLTGDATGDRMVPVEIVTTKPRMFSWAVVGGYAYNNGSGTTRNEGIKITPDQPLSFKVKSDRDSKQPWFLVVVDDEQSRFTAKGVVFGHPPDGASVKERVLSEYSLFGSRMVHRLEGGLSTSSPEFAAELFTTIDERFFVWMNEEKPCHDATGPIKPDEPLLLDFLGSNDVQLRRANGERAMCYLDPDLDMTTKRPATIAMPPAVPPKVSETQNLWNDEEFLPQAEGVPRIAAYKERKAKVSGCFDREWDKHDPDGTAGKYDVVQFDSRGNIKKVESMSDRIMRKVDKVCKVTALEKERDAIRKELRTQGEAKSAEALARVAAHFAK